MIEQKISCPHCWQEISMLLDASINKQSYIEDCEVCCNPIQITIVIENNELVAFSAKSIEQ
ncbi:MAG: CPXCG motif-containing cysteine-rich protein [Oceanihabitans sp.]